MNKKHYNAISEDELNSIKTIYPEHFQRPRKPLTGQKLADEAKKSLN